MDDMNDEDRLHQSGIHGRGPSRLEGWIMGSAAGTCAALVSLFLWLIGG